MEVTVVMVIMCACDHASSVIASSDHQGMGRTVLIQRSV